MNGLLQVRILIQKTLLKPMEPQFQKHQKKQVRLKQEHILNNSDITKLPDIDG